MGADFYSRIAPWTLSATGGPINLADGATQAVLAAVASGFSRWVLGFSVASNDLAGGAPILLRTTVNHVGIATIGWRFGPNAPVLNQLLTNSLDTALEMKNVAGNGAAAPLLVWTVVYADTPPNILSDLIQGLSPS
jgi:hypothetical protein